MNRISLILCVCLLCVLSIMHIPVEAAQAEFDLWQNIAPGIDYREFHLRTPNRAYVARLDRAAPSLTLESSIAQGYLNTGSATVSQMAARNDQSISFWGEEWGTRSQVVVAINGFFFDSETGLPWQGQIISGWYAKRFDERQSGSGLVWTLGGDLFIGGCVTHPNAKQTVLFTARGEELTIDNINTLPRQNELTLYTPQFDLTTPASDERVEILVSLNRPLMIIPAPNTNDGTVQAVSLSGGPMPIPFDHIVLSASGEKAERLKNLVQTGDQIGISQEIKHYEPNCNTPAANGWEKTYTAIGASFLFLENGEIRGFEDLGALLRSPRTAVAFNDRYIYFVVIDGRDRFQSVGMSVVELATFAKNTLGATWGSALDGGGSSTMVVNGQVVNKPNIEYQSPGSAGKLLVNTTERVVGNGLMMTITHPKQQSDAYQPGDMVRTLLDANLRLGPGLNYGAIATISANSAGQIIQHENGLNGVFASDRFWWKVEFGGLTGWIAEDLLVFSN